MKPKNLKTFSKKPRFFQLWAAQRTVRDTRLEIGPAINNSRLHLGFFQNCALSLTSVPATAIAHSVSKYTRLSELN